MEYTQQQYQTAIKNALAAGDRPAAERMAREAASLYGPAQSVPEQAVPEQAAPTTMELLQQEIRGFVPTVEERFSRITGENPSIAEQVVRAPEKAMIGVSQAARAGGAVAMSAINDIIPNFVKEGAEEAFNKVKKTDAFKTAVDVASMGLEAYTSWAEANPAIAERFETSIDIGTLFGPRPDLKKVVDKTTGRVEDIVFKDKKEGVTQLLKPETYRPEDVVEEVGVLRTQKWVPSPRELQTIEEVSKIESVNPSLSFTKNYYNIQKDIDTSAKKVEKLIAAQNKAMPKGEVDDRILRVVVDIEKDPAFLAAPDAAKRAANQYGFLAMELIEKYGSDLNGIHKARQEFDKQVKAISEKLIGADAATGRALAVRAVRTEMNDMLKENTAGEELHGLLTRQHHSYNALDAMANKRRAELGNSLKRLAGWVSDVANLPSSPLALAATGTAVASFFGGTAAAVGVGTAAGGVYAGFKATRPAARAKVLAALVNAVDKTIGNTKDPNILGGLKADRAVLVAYLEEARDEAKEESKN